MNKYIYYVARCSYPAWRGVHWYTTIGATDKSVREKNPNAIEIEIENVAFDLDKPVVQVPTSSQFTDYTNEFVFVGEPVDSKGTPTGIRYITIRELLPQATVWWEKQLEKQRGRMNAYYSQKWV
tara:strand:+ start:102 stop:473 length:372 start_codon:yes stop_codon:yes gene_type:complete